MIGQHTYPIDQTAALLWLEAGLVAIRAVLLLVLILHGNSPLISDLLTVPALAIDQLDQQIIRCNLWRAHPGPYFDCLAQAELTLAASLHVESQALPALLNALFPLSQCAGQLVGVLLDPLALLNLGYIEACRVFLHHPSRTEVRGTGADGFFHIADPAMRQTAIGQIALIVGRDDLPFQESVERQTVSLILNI